MQSSRQAHAQAGLKRTLSIRHLVMLSLGGSIGTGLFLASGAPVSQAGPSGALLAYALIGVMKASAAPMMATVDVIAAVMTEREVLAVGATTFRVNILEYAQAPEPAQQWQAAAMSSGVKVSLAAMR